jgi:hypothetical protein
MWAMRARDAEEGSVDYGNYRVKWVRQEGGSWRIHRNTGNSAQPAGIPLGEG